MPLRYFVHAGKRTPVFCIENHACFIDMPKLAAVPQQDPGRIVHHIALRFDFLYARIFDGPGLSKENSNMN